jgi:stage II sporulation protein D
MFEMKFRDSLRKYDLYRGLMQMRVTPTGLQTVNHVLMDDYLKGVVPAEVPASWPREAVRAQAVAARNYAMTHLKPTGFWDLQPTAANQVYGGWKIEHPKSNQAVIDTSGVVVLAPNGNLANTYFFATAGGHTENNEFAWPTDSGKVVGTPISYLRGVPDLDLNGVPYDAAASDSSWSTNQFTWAQLEQILAADTRTNVGTLTSLEFKRGVSGRVYQAILVGTAGTKTVNGAIFENIYNRNPAGGTRLLKSTCFYLEPAPSL